MPSYLCLLHAAPKVHFRVFRYYASLQDQPICSKGYFALFSQRKGIYLLCCCCSAAKCLTLYDLGDCGTAAHQASLSFTISWNLLKLMSIESVMPFNHLILYRPLLLLPSILTSISVFSNELPLHITWPKYWSFSFCISPSNGYPELISVRTDWFDLLTVQGTLESLLQHHSSKASILQHSTFLMVQLSHLYMTTGKTIALTRCTLVSKEMSLLFNMLSRCIIAFLPRNVFSFH